MYYKVISLKKLVKINCLLKLDKPFKIKVKSILLWSIFQEVISITIFKKKLVFFVKILLECLLLK
jgi:hypothetical protein